MLHTPTRVGLVAALVFAFAVVWYYEGRGRWRARLADRFVLGVPWGTLVTVAVVVGFYLFAQSGLEHWESPVVYPFVTWSYFYPTGILTAGIAHGSAGHIVGNMTGTLAFAPIVEYAWGHYPPASGGRERLERRKQQGRREDDQRPDGRLPEEAARAAAPAFEPLPAAGRRRIVPPGVLDDW